MVSHFYQKRLPFSFVLVFGLCISPSLAHKVGQFQEVEDALTAKHYSEAAKRLIPLAEHGNAKAARMLADLYMKGQGVQKNSKKAKCLLEQSSASGDPEGMCSLAIVLKSESIGLNSSADKKRALILLERSANLGCIRANYLMGLEYMWGTTTKQNFVQAVKYFQPIAQAGNGDAECILAHFYEEGLGVPQNTQKAATLFKLAKRHGCANGEYAIGRTYLYGLGTAEDDNKAFKWLSQAALDGNEHAVNDLGTMYANGKGVERNDKKAVELYLQAEKIGCPFAKLTLAERYRTGRGLKKNTQKAKTLFEELAKQGNTIAAEKLKLLPAN